MELPRSLRINPIPSWNIANYTNFHTNQVKTINIKLIFTWLVEENNIIFSKKPQYSTENPRETLSSKKRHNNNTFLLWLNKDEA